MSPKLLPQIHGEFVGPVQCLPARGAISRVAETVDLLTQHVQGFAKAEVQFRVLRFHDGHLVVGSLVLCCRLLFYLQFAQCSRQRAFGVFHFHLNDRNVLLSAERAPHGGVL